MKLLFKTLLFSFAFIQIAQAGRYYNSDYGRFVSRDPIGYVDGMSLYNAYFAEKFTLDPMGTNALPNPIDVKCKNQKIGKITFTNFNKLRDVLKDKGLFGLKINAQFSLDSGKSYTDSPCCCDELRWTQVVTTNIPLVRVREKSESYVDPNEPNRSDPFYFDTHRDPNNPGAHIEHFRGNGTLDFEDEPIRPYKGIRDNEVAKWNATNCLVCVKHSMGGTSIVPLACFSYGFSASNKKDLKLDDIKEVKPPKNWKDTVNDFGKGFSTP